MSVASSLAVVSSALSSPQFAVLVHTVHKGAQTGALLGCILAPPLYHVRREDDFYAQSFTFATSGVVLNSALVGVSVSLLLLYFKSRDDDVDWLDMAKRIQANAFQSHIDRLSFTGAVVGALVGAPTALIAVSDISNNESARARVARRAIRGAAVGCAVGVICATVFWRRIPYA
jgi:hypothetical protein